ncbi:LysR substrate-binding domain-containing protein [Methylobacterium sp. J-077]|uniref:LysR substrate-binding domain-containing protein n=1 Tax=Methylobacterium sp. J-077 TaxID=2836656 RepID=UPI0028C3C0B3|nr:LysR substrate-binding domain-containing protein [Methylobacterium sp. J-077]
MAGRLTVNDTEVLLGACLSGLGIAQPPELYARNYITDGRRVPLLEDWAEGSFPLHAYLPTRQHISAKVRAILAFVGAAGHTGMSDPGPSGTNDGHRDASERGGSKSALAVIPGAL